MTAIFLVIGLILSVVGIVASVTVCGSTGGLMTGLAFAVIVAGWRIRREHRRHA